MKHKISFRYKILLGILFLLSQASCKKFLDEKPDQKLATPSTLFDLQSLLNSGFLVLDGASDEVSADNYYLTTAIWQALSPEFERRIYTWEKDHIFHQTAGQWFSLYRKVYYCNTVLDYLPTIERTASNATEWDYVKAEALMFRSIAFLEAVCTWSLAYDPATAATDLGIPLRLNSDFNEPSERASVKESYGQIINDMKAAIPNLPAVSIHPFLWSRSAAYAYLARTYLYMRDYTNAGHYADSSLMLYSTLLNYNTLNAAATYPFPQFHAEVLKHAGQLPLQLTQSRARIDSNLYNSYTVNDCRKTLFFKANGDGTYAFKGSYANFDGLFTGMATDEVYLMRAECAARAGNTAAALTDLNTLLQMRMKTGTFIPVTAASASQALAIILTERRKELLLRSVRWMDIKRLNKEGAAITLTRIVNNQLYTLPPNDLRYALAIPEYIIDISGIPQNPR